MKKYNYIGTQTGRFTSKVPNLIKVKKDDPRFEKLNTSAKTFFECDLSKLGPDLLRISIKPL